MTKPRKPYTIKDGVCYVPLACGKEAMVDEADADLVSQYLWQYHPQGVVHYVGTSIKGSDGKWRRVRMHRFLMQPPQTMVVDHINHNGLDNRRSNLRIVDRGINKRNSRPRGTSKYLGVHLVTKKKIWCASIKLPSGKYKNLGLFKIEEDAAAAYKAAVKEHFPILKEIWDAQ